MFSTIHFQSKNKNRTPIMRITIQQTTIILELDDKQEQPVKRPNLTPLSLLEKLKTEVEKGRDANLWKTEDQYGTIFPKQR